MHPAFSVIIFTVTSGAGFGLFSLLAILHAVGLLPAASRGELMTAAILALVLTTAGLISSTQHLANPKNAWRAFFRFKTSWLSREGVFSVLFYPFALLYLLGLWQEGAEPGGWFLVAGVIAAILAQITVFTTGMIYACLKTIRQWHTALTPANYILLGLMLGGLLLATVRAGFGHEAGIVMGLTVALVVIAAITKAIYYFWIAQNTGPSINTATSFNRATVRLLDVGHSAGTFLTREFGYKAPADLVFQLKGLVFVLGFILPLVAIAYALLTSASVLSAASFGVLSAFIGIGIERWLFFAEARHVVNLYHGAQRT